MTALRMRRKRERVLLREAEACCVSPESSVQDAQARAARAARDECRGEAQRNKRSATGRTPDRMEIHILCPGPSLAGAIARGEVPWRAPEGVYRVGVNRAYGLARCDAWALDYLLMAGRTSGFAWRPVHPCTVVMRRRNWLALERTLTVPERVRFKRATGRLRLVAVEDLPTLDGPPPPGSTSRGGGGWDKHSSVIALRYGWWMAREGTPGRHLALGTGEDRRQKKIAGEAGSRSPTSEASRSTKCEDPHGCGVKIVVFGMDLAGDGYAGMMAAHRDCREHGLAGCESPTSDSEPSRGDGTRTDAGSARWITERALVDAVVSAIEGEGIVVEGV